MSNFIILGDLHIGARAASTNVAEFQIKFFEDVLFPFMEKHKIKTILQLGDVFDTRKFTNSEILYMWKKRVFDVMEVLNIEICMLVGNHDSSKKNTIDINTPSLLFGEYKNINVIDSPREENICGIDFLMIPWICQSNIEQVEIKISTSDAIFCAGHFEFEGFDMHKGQLAIGGYSTEPYKNFDMVFSGHFHTRTKKKNIQYVGTPYEMTWIDYGDIKGFHVFNVKNHKFKFYENPNSLFHRIEYDENIENIADLSSLKNSYVKIVVINKTDIIKFEKFISKINSVNPADLKIIDIEVDYSGSDLDESIDVSDTKTLMKSYVDKTEIDLDKECLNDVLTGYYVRALDVVPE